MEKRIVIKPGRPVGFAEAKCPHCGEEAYVHGSIIRKNENAGRWAFNTGMVECGNCGESFGIPLCGLPADVKISGE